MTETTESMAAEWEKWLELERVNIETLKKRIESLSANHESPDGFKYGEFWAETKEISGMFETLTPLPKDEKELLQEKYERVCGDVKRKQQQELQVRRGQERQVREKQEHEWQARRGQSKQVRDSIEGKIQEALSAAEAAPEDVAVLAKAQLALNEALVLLKGSPKPADSAAAEDGKQAVQVNDALLRDDRQNCWQKWRAANDLIFGRRQAIWDRNFAQVQPEANAALTEANDGDSFQALEKVKAVQNRLKESPLSRSQRDEIKATLNSAWDVAIAKVNVIRDANRQKHEKWLDRMKTNVDRWAVMIQKNKEEISELEDQIKRLQAEIKVGRSPEYTDSLKTLVKDKRLKIGEIGETNKSIEADIVSAKEKLSGHDKDKANSGVVRDKGPGSQQKEEPKPQVASENAPPEASEKPPAS